MEIFKTICWKNIPENSAKGSMVNGITDDVSCVRQRALHSVSDRKNSNLGNSLSSVSKPNYFNPYFMTQPSPYHNKSNLPLQFKPPEYYPNPEVDSPITSEDYGPNLDFPIQSTKIVQPHFSSFELTSPPMFKYSLLTHYSKPMFDFTQSGLIFLTQFLQPAITMLTEEVRSLTNEELERQWKPGLHLQIVTGHCCKGREFKANYYPP